MIDIGKGIIAGLFASAALAGLVLLAAWMDLIQTSDPTRAVSGVLIVPSGLSWVAHFALGTFLWGTLFSVLASFLPGPYWLRGLLFGGIALLLMLLMNWAAAPISLPPGDPRPILLHLLFGAVLGLIYGALLDRAEQ